MSWYVYGVILIVHNFGWVIYRASTSQKAEFRKNPLKPSLSRKLHLNSFSKLTLYGDTYDNLICKSFVDLETIPTSQGKKLLVSGWFGWIRHPNYLGVFIMHLCWTALCGMKALHAIDLSRNFVFPSLTTNACFISVKVLHTSYLMFSQHLLSYCLLRDHSEWMKDANNAMVLHGNVTTVVLRSACSQEFFKTPIFSKETF